MIKFNMKRRIKTSHEDNRHTTKPYNEYMWDLYEYRYHKFTTEELARKYNVTKRTIYHWNSEMRKARNLKTLEKRHKSIG